MLIHCTKRACERLNITPPLLRHTIPSSLASGRIRCQGLGVVGLDDVFSGIFEVVWLGWMTFMYSREKGN